MSLFGNQNTWIVSTKSADGSARAINGTASIAVSFVFLAYFLHPAIEKAYHRMRAYRAWRAIEKQEEVEVTNYSMTSEIFGARGIWDASRIITFLLAAFSLASWGLELQLDLANIDQGPVNLLNSPPPVTLRSDQTFWEVLRPSDGLDAEPGSLCNMDDDYANGAARSRYHVENYKYKVDGDIKIAWWSDDVEDRPQQFYNTNETTTTVTSLECSISPKNVTMFVKDSNTPWGTVHECEEGPLLSGASRSDKPNSPPTIIMNNTADGTVHIIVEESSRYPSFLYSVWTAGDEVGGGVEIHHLFHIASTMRLVEAVVTGIVHGLDNGGGCFGLLRQYSENHFDDDTQIVSRASPFGEKPDFGVVGSLEEVETIEAGVEVSIFVLLCAVWLTVLTSIGFVWSFCLRESIGMDVYDRDELIRAVSMPVAGRGTVANSLNGDSRRSSIRIFVRKEDAGQISVAVSEAAVSEGLFKRIFRRRPKVKAHDERAPVSAAMTTEHNTAFGGPAVTEDPCTVWLGGQSMRHGIGRGLPTPQGDFLYPSMALTASPASFTVRSLVGTPALASKPVRAGHNLMPGRGHSFLLDAGCSPGRSGAAEDMETGLGVEGAVGGWPGVGNTETVPRVKNIPARDASEMDVATGRRNSKRKKTLLPWATTPAASVGPSSVRPRELASASTPSPPQFSRLLRNNSDRLGSAGSEGDLKE